MPPSKKKQSRPLVSPSSSSSSLIRTPSISSFLLKEAETRSSNGESEENYTKRVLALAAEKFPDFISESAFYGKVSEIDSKMSSASRVCISQEAMVSNSLLPETLVTVSLSPFGKEQMKNYQLVSLAKECGRHFSFDSYESDDKIEGNYFAIATVSCSQKILRNGVTLSWALACTMGFPASGTGVFISAIRNLSPSNGTSRISNNLQMKLTPCEDLYLSVRFAKAVKKENSLSADIPRQTSSAAIAKESNLSPKTPSCKPRVSSSVSSPQSNSSQIIKSKGDCSAFIDASILKEILGRDGTIEMLEILSSRWLYGRLLFRGNFVAVSVCGRICIFQVGSAQNIASSRTNMNQSSSLKNTQTPTSDDKLKTIFLVGTKTKLHLCDSLSSIKKATAGVASPSMEQKYLSIKDRKVDDARKLGGLAKEFSALKEIMTFSLVNKGSLLRYKGVLLHGPPGTGKTSLASFCSHDVGASLFTINGPEIISQYYGESEQALYNVFDAARRSAPAVVFIDELDAIAPARKDGSEELSLRLVATLLKLMDEITKGDCILVIAATNRPDSIDPALRRPGRLDKEIEIGVPSPEQRLDILQNLLDAMGHSLSNGDIQSLALATHGFVGADLAALCNEAAMTALRRYIEFKKECKDLREHLAANVSEGSKTTCYMHEDDDGSCVHHVVDSLASSLSDLKLSFKVDREEMLLQVTAEDFDIAKQKVRPSAMREVMLEFPKVSWDDVGGQSKVKTQLIEAVQWPQLCPDAFKRIGIQPPRGLLMIGPPGCSKTLMARAVASEAKLNFLAVKGPELFSKWVGESEKAVRSLFAKARANAPAIIFFDEIDGLAITRGQENDGTSVADRVLSQLLVEMDGLEQRSRVVVIAATNRPDKIDPALLRPGRFDRLLDVQPPDEFDREAIFRIHMRNMPCNSDVSPRELACLTDGYTGADIKLICREGAIAALEESLEISEVLMAHFKIGLGRVHPSNLEFYQELAAKFRRFVDSVPEKAE